MTNNIIRRIVLYVDKILYELQYDTTHRLTYEKPNKLAYIGFENVNRPNTEKKRFNKTRDSRCLQDCESAKHEAIRCIDPTKIEKYKERNDRMTYQLTAPLLDACVLGVVEKEDVYGYTLTQRVMDVVDISESTLYPVLRRLQKSGLLETYDVPYQGRNRRYYRITPPGREQLGFFRSEWITYKDNIDLLLGVNKLLTAN